MKRTSLTFVLLLLAFVAFPQTKTKISLTAILEQAIFEAPNNELNFSNLEITLDELPVGLNEYIIEKYSSDKRFKLDSGNIVIPNNLYFFNCTWPDQLLPGVFVGFAFQEFGIFDRVPQAMNFAKCSFSFLVITADASLDIQFESCMIDLLDLQGGGIKNNIYINDSKFKKATLYLGDGTATVLNSHFTTSLKPLNASCASAEDSLQSVYNTQFINQNNASLKITSTGERLFVRLSKNKFLNGTYKGYVGLDGQFSAVAIEKNIFENALIMDGTVNDKLVIRQNTFSGGVSFADLQFPEANNNFNWAEFNGLRLFRATYFVDSVHQCELQKYLILPKKYYQVFRGVTNREHKDVFSYEEHMSTYQRLNTIFKDRGDVTSANGCYVEMKDIQTAKLQSTWEQEGSFNAYVRWKLSRIMKFYSDHGTDPARSIAVSIWVILGFAIFFFFFPSDWDVTSKAKLMKDYRTFIEKNESGYVKPFLMLTLGFVVSLINAFTLSINSFTTLGFGNIPTHGIAKYFCVLEGFIGWFLLSIFTVALINQVLA